MRDVLSDFRTLDDLDNIRGKVALVRVDFNLPMDAGRVTDATRLESALPTILELAQKGAKTVLMSHFDRPQGQRLLEMSLRPIIEPLSQALNKEVQFAKDCIDQEARTAVAALPASGILLLENLRFHSGEETNDPVFSRGLAKLADFYVNDAFSVSHRSHASTVGVAQLLPGYVGRSMERELRSLDRVLRHPKRPLVGIVGGSKVSTKLDLLHNLITKLDHLVIGGGMANSFLYAKGYDIGQSLCEKNMADTARAILAKAENCGCQIVLPIDVICAEAPRSGVHIWERPITDIQPQDKIFDIGPLSIARILSLIDQSKSLVWNGPFGLFEVSPFEKATVTVAHHLANRVKSGDIIAVAGGGDTVAALNLAGVIEDFSFVSTAGGAFLEWMEGKPLPGVEVLEVPFCTSDAC